MISFVYDFFDQRSVFTERIIVFRVPPLPSIDVLRWDFLSDKVDLVISITHDNYNRSFWLPGWKTQVWHQKGGHLLLVAILTGVSIGYSWFNQLHLMNLSTDFDTLVIHFYSIIIKITSIKFTCKILYQRL